MRSAFLPFVLIATSLTLCHSGPAIAQGVIGETVNYTVLRGDTLIGVSQRYLINIAAANAVQRLNGIRDAARIPPGTVLRIPTTLLKSTPIAARVIAFSGSVTINTQNSGAAPTIGQALSEGMTLSTGAPGFLTISLAEGSNVSIPSRSKVRITRLRRYLLTGGNDIDFLVEQGRAETAVTPIRDANSRFKMRTPTAVSAVRGTVFRVAYNGPGSASLTEVVEGGVGVNSLQSAEQALIPMGFGAALPLTGRILKEVLLPPPQVTNARAVQTNDKVEFSLSAVEGAKNYHTQIARDAGFLEMFAENFSTSPTATFEAIPDGSYFVRSMAVAESGLEGLTETVGFRRSLAKVSPEAASISSDNSIRILWSPQGTGSATYRFQLFEAKSEDLPVVDEPGLETTGITLTNLPPGKYTWRVGMRQAKSEGVVESWSGVQNFTIYDR